MGMFDEIRCEVPLPDGGRVADVQFQTKTFPCPCMQRYVITQAGRLVDSLGNDLEPDGYITFYSAAVESASGAPGGLQSSSSGDREEPPVRRRPTV